MKPTARKLQLRATREAQFAQGKKLKGRKRPNSVTGTDDGARP
jgi:hypothetical protein